MDTTMKETSNNNQPDATSTEDCSGVFNDGIEEPNGPCSIISTNFSEKAFDTIIHLIKTENVSLFDEECSGSEDTISIISKPVDTKYINQPQVNMWCNVASTSGEKYVNISESNSQVFSDTELVDSKITSKHTSSTSNTIMRLSSKPLSHICLQSCLWCDKPFRVLDNPYHISRIRSIDKQNEFLKIEPTLTIDSCLCDFCWKFLERSYRSNMAEKKTGDLSFLHRRARLLERYPKKSSSKNKSQSRRCSMHYCSKPHVHKVSVEQYNTITQLLSTFEFYNFVFVPSRKTSPELLKFPFCLCNDDLAIIVTITSCQICGDNLQEPFNTDDWLMYETWNWKLITNKIPLLLQAGMFLCMTCKRSLSTKSGAFPAVVLPKLLENINIMKQLRLKVYGPPLYNLYNICQEPTYCIAPPIVVPNMMKQQRVRSEIKVIFSNPLITATFHYEYDDDKNNTDTYITSTKLCIPKLEPIDEGLNSVKIEEEYVQTCMANEDPNVSGIEIPNSLIKNDDIKTEYIPDQNSLKNVSGDNYFSDTVTNYVVTTNMDDNKDLLHSYVKNEMSKNEDNNQYPGIANVNSLQNQYQVDNLKIEENVSEIIDTYSQYSHQVGNGHNEIENYQSESKIKDFNSQQQDVCNVAQYKNSTELEENNHCINLINWVINTINQTEYLNESDNSMYSNIAAVEPPKATEPLKRKRTISNESVKKQRLNETNSSYDNSSIGDSTTSNINSAHPSTNASNTCGNKHLPNSDFIDVLPSNVDEESINPQSDFMITNLPSIYNVELSDSESLSESIVLSDSDFIEFNPHILSDDEVFSDTISEFSSNTSESELMETDWIIVTDDVNLDTIDDIINTEDFDDENFETAISKTILDTNTTNHLNNLKEIKWTIVDDVKKSERVIESHGEVELPSGDEEFHCIIMSENRSNMVDSLILYDDEIEQSSGDEESQTMVISENENNIIDSRIISYDEIKRSSSDKKSQCVIISDNEEVFNNMNISNIISMSDINKMVNSQALKPSSINNSRFKSGFFEFPCLQLTGDHSFNDVLPDVLPDELHEYFEDICEAIRFFFNDVEDQSLKTLYSVIGNETDMLLYLMENLRMLYNGELILSGTACPSDQNYYTEQMETLYNHYGDPKFNINASKPLILPSSRLHQYSKRLSPTVEPLKIIDITSTSTSVQNSSNVLFTSPKDTATDISVSKIKNRCTPCKAKQSFPLFNPLSNSRNIVPANIVPRSSKTRTICTKPLLSNIIPYSPNDKSTLTPSIPHQTQIKVQLPSVVLKRKRDNTKVYYCPKILAPPPPAIPIPKAMRSSIMQTKPPVLWQKNQHSINY